MSDLRVLVSSPIDRESVVAELWSGDEQIAELRQDGHDLRLELYNSGRLRYRDLNFVDFLAALVSMKTAIAPTSDLPENT